MSATSIRNGLCDILQVLELRPIGKLYRTIRQDNRIGRRIEDLALYQRLYPYAGSQVERKSTCEWFPSLADLKALSIVSLVGFFQDCIDPPKSP